MSEAKRVILDRVQKALSNVPDAEQPADAAVPRTYLKQGKRTVEERVALFIKRLSEYKATVKRVDQGSLVEVITKSCRSEKVDQLTIPEGFPQQWIPDTVNPLFDKAALPLSYQALDNADGVISTCALAIAQTGTIMLDAGEGQGRRALTLLPDYHICIVREHQIVELVPEGFAYVESVVKKKGPPITLISGPSATSDIELNRVEGVHGPRRLEVLVIQD
jgi:L-lactate dehydrogenase complex protein LldG